MSERFKLLLGEPLWKLAAEAGSELVEAEDISPFPSTVTPRRAYRLVFEDGRTLKGRRLNDEQMVRKARLVREGASGLFFPRILATAGNAMLEEWIEGEQLVVGRIEPALIRECGRQLGALHHAPLPETGGNDFAGWGAANRMEMTVDNLRALHEGGAMSKSRADELERVVRAELPRNSVRGLVVRDMCPENLILDAKGKVFCVDAGSLTIGPIDEDLCRTWHRWPMTDAERDVFAEGYRERGEPAAFLQPPIFWAIVVMANSARFRMKSRPADTAATLRKLDAFLESVNA